LTGSKSCMRAGGGRRTLHNIRFELWGVYTPEDKTPVRAI
jgi:hypothetical protein